MSRDPLARCVRALLVCARRLGLTPDDVVCVAAPMGTALGFGRGALPALLAGTRVRQPPHPSPHPPTPKIGYILTEVMMCRTIFGRCQFELRSSSSTWR